MDLQAAGGDTKTRSTTAANVAEARKSKDRSPMAAELVLRHKGVSIVLQFSEEPTREVFEYLGRYSEFEKENYPPAVSLPPKPDELAPLGG